MTAFRPRFDPKRSRNISIFEYSELNISKAHQRTIITAKKSHGTLKITFIYYLARNCESTFNVYKFESTTDKANDKFPEWTEARNGYQKLKTIAAQDRFNM